MFVEEMSGEALLRAAYKKFAEAEAWPHLPGKTDEELKKQCYNADALISLKSGFQKDGNPLDLLYAITNSVHAEFPLPIWAHIKLGAVVRQYIYDEGKTTLDEILGLKPGRGRNSHLLKQHESKSKKEYVAYYIKRLHQYFGFTLPVTYFLLSIAGIESPDLSEPRIFYSRDRLEEIYKQDKTRLEFDEPELGESKLPQLYQEGYADMIFSNEKALKGAGLYDSAIRTVNKILKG